MTCEELHRRLAGDSLIRNCSQLDRPAGTLRIQTIFRYPGGEYVDLFWRPRDAGDQVGELTDFGQTISHLLSLNLDPDANEKRKEFIVNACRELHVQRRGGQLVAEPNQDRMLKAVVNLGQACVRVADLFLTHRLRPLASTFSDDLQEGIESLGRPYDRNVPMIGHGGRRVTVDFQVQGEHRINSILTMSARNAGTAHQKATDVFTKWYDLDGYQPDFRFVTVVDSASMDRFDEQDISRLEQISTVISYPADGDELRDTLNA